MTTTTQQLVAKKSRFKLYETLEMKRRYNFGYESSYTDLSSYLLASSTIKISSKLDFDSFGYGEMKTGNISFTLDNTQGYFNNEESLYSFFSNTVSRHYTKVRYKAGYYDEANDKIDEIVFMGFINEKEVKNNFTKGTIEMTALSANQILHETFVQSGSISTYNYFTDIINGVINTADISPYITYSSSNINPFTNLYFDDASFYENKSIADALNEMCQKANSIWYIDIDGNFIVRDRELNSNTPFNFIGGAGQKYSTNIIEIELYDEGYTKLINSVIYKTTSIYQNSASDELLAKHGTNALTFDSTDITNSTTIASLSENIIEEWKLPRKRIILTTVYMPNVLDYFDKCTISYKPNLKRFNNKNVMIWNGGGQFNADDYWGVYANQIILNPDRYWSYYGYEHDIAKGITRHYLVEKEFIGVGLNAFVWNLGYWNNEERWNVV